MGCGTSTNYPDENDFLNAEQKDINSERLADQLAKDDSKVCWVHLRKGVTMDPKRSVLTGENGVELFAIENIRGKKHVRSLKDDSTLCCMEFHKRRVSYVNGIDSDCSWPHHYIYCPRPFREGQQATEYDGENPLYLWARVDKRSNVGTIKMSVSFAELLGSKEENMSYFGLEKILIVVLADGRMIMKTSENKGICLVDHADGENVQDSYRIAFVPCADHVMLASTVLCIEALLKHKGE